MCKDLKALEMLRGPGDVGEGGEVHGTSVVGVGTPSPGGEIHPRVRADLCEDAFGEGHLGVQGNLGP